MNWRRSAIAVLLRATGSHVLTDYREMVAHEFDSRESQEKRQHERLEALLFHASETTPYYSKVLRDCGVVIGGKVHLDRFDRIPFLTKDLMRARFYDLRSRNPRGRVLDDTSGGSTGEPVRFQKDQRYWDFGIAATLYFMHLVGKELGEPELKLWGSERDTLVGHETLAFRLKNWLYNAKLINSFRMTPNDLARAVRTFNDFRPKSVWTYVESIDELARYLLSHPQPIHRPHAIVTTAGTLTEPIRGTIEQAFRTKAYNQYGSREVGCIASECERQEGLHIFTFGQHLEVLDVQGRAVPPGMMGENVVTCLTNYAFPLIRFQIGDTSIPSDRTCSCGRNLPLLKSVTGRVSDHFRTQDGTIIHGEYFTHLFYFRNWIKKFQVVQHDYSDVEVKIIQLNNPVQNDLVDIETKIKHVLGNNCRVRFSYVDDIPPTSSGKYRYTISEIKTHA